MSADINEYVKAAQDHPSMRRAQVQSAGAVVAQFLLVRDALSGKVQAGELNGISATLTAGIFAGSST